MYYIVLAANLLRWERMFHEYLLSSFNIQVHWALIKDEYVQGAAAEKFKIGPVSLWKLKHYFIHLHVPSPYHSGWND